MLRTRRRISRLLVRSVGQVTVSVLATVAATAIYGALRHGYGEIASPPAPDGADVKLRTRIEGAASPAFEAPASRLPILSVINWSAPDSPALGGTGRGSTPPAASPLRPAHPRPARRAETAALVQPPARPPASPAEAMPAPLPGPIAANPAWRAASGAVTIAGATLGAAGGTVSAAARGAVTLGGALLGHVIP